jgi:hypothetical protein
MKFFSLLVLGSLTSVEANFAFPGPVHPTMLPENPALVVQRTEKETRQRMEGIKQGYSMFDGDNRLDSDLISMC